ncbi:hypothetical protein F5Y03DRAFT_4559 [Xylaria venustula]|nr:hypothetical protein F5Y03DRAFT_4559 [Xylaria venustula]
MIGSTLTFPCLTQILIRLILLLSESFSSTSQKPRAPTARKMPDRKLACPFFKRDGGTQRSCMGPGWASISRLKEHLYRCHTAPKNQCYRCRQGFHSATLLATHQRALEPCPLNEAPLAAILTGDQEAQLRCRARKPAGYSMKEQWEAVYRIVFPGENPIPSPYYDTMCFNCMSRAGSHLPARHRQCQSRELRPLIQQELAALPDLCDTTLRARIADSLSTRIALLLNNSQESQILDSNESSQPLTESQLSNGVSTIPDSFQLDVNRHAPFGLDLLGFTDFDDSLSLMK